MCAVILTLLRVEVIQRAPHAVRYAVKAVRADHRRAHILVAEQALHCVDIVAILDLARLVTCSSSQVDFNEALAGNFVKGLSAPRQCSIRF